MSLTKVSYSMIRGAPVSVLDFGAVGDGVTNDYSAFVAAAAHIQANGGGRLVIPFRPLGYSITCPSNNGPVCDFSGLNLVTIDGDGAYIRFENTYSSSQGNTLFQFDACNNIRIRGLFVFNNYTKTVVQSGVRFSYFTNECQGVSIDDVTFWGGLAFVQVYKDPADGYGPTNQARGFRIGRVRVKNAWYGINCQYNGDDFMVENLETDEVHRSYFIYGVRHHKAFIRSKNNVAEDVAIGSLDGFGCENIDIDYINTDSTAPTSGNRGSCVDIGLNEGTTYPGPAVMRNIKVNVTATVVPNAMGYGFTINSGDSVAPGHVLENIELRGSFSSTWATFNPIHIGYVYPATGTNFLRNLRLKDIWVGGQAANSFINCRNISFMKLENVNTVAGCFLYGGGDGSKILVENCAATSFSNSAVDATAVQFVNTVMTTGTGQGLLNKTIQNSKIGVAPLNMMPRVWAVLDPAGAVKQSVGVVSTSKIGTGYYAINFETAYSQGNYSGLANISGGAFFCEVLQWSSTQARVQVYNTSGVLVDPANEIMFGLFANPAA